MKSGAMHRDDRSDKALYPEHRKKAFVKLISKKINNPKRLGYEHGKRCSTSLTIRDPNIKTVTTYPLTCTTTGKMRSTGSTEGWSTD